MRVIGPGPPYYSSQTHHLFGLLGVQAIRLVKEFLVAVHNVSHRVEVLPLSCVQTCTRF